MGMKRIAKCNPWGTSGYDPVPKRCNHDHDGDCNHDHENLEHEGAELVTDLAGEMANPTDPNPGHP